MSKRYKKTAFLGDGQFGIVYAAKDMEDPEKKIVAVKNIKITNVRTESRDGINRTALREIKLQKEVDHPNVLALLDVFGKPGSSVSLVFPFCKTDLEKIIQDQSLIIRPPDIKSFILQTLVGLDYLHQHWILHRDLKPGNLLIDTNGVLKIADFGLSKIYGSPNREMTSQVFTRWYRSPELLYGAKHYTTSVDIWAVGCIIAELCLRVPIFQGESDLMQLSKIFDVTGTPIGVPSESAESSRHWPGVDKYQGFITFNDTPGQPFSQIFKDFGDEFFVQLVEQCLRLNPLLRCTCQQALQMKYFSETPFPTKPEFLPGIKVNASTDKINGGRLGSRAGKRKRDECFAMDDQPKSSVAKKLTFN